jgi:hypothetical protein
MKAAAAGVEATTASMKAAAAGVEATATTAVPATTAATAMPGESIDRSSRDHGHPGQKREGKLAFHVTPVLLRAAPCACVGGTCPEPKLRQSRRGFRIGQSNLRKVALRHSRSESVSGRARLKPARGNADDEHRMSFVVRFLVRFLGHGRIDA